MDQKSLERRLVSCREGEDPKNWNPPLCGDLDMLIVKDGSWLYQGTPVARPSLIKLFARILRQENGEYFLVTPVEKLRIRVEDAPFVAVSTWKRAKDGVIFVETNVGDEVALRRPEDVRVDWDASTQTPRPYVHVRDGLWALLARPVYYQWVDWSVPRDFEDGWHAVLISGNATLDLGRMDEADD